MIVGAHSIIYSKDAEADRAFLRDVLGFPHVDVGHGWLIFGLPPSEVGVHPGDENSHHEFYLMTDDVDAFTAQMQARGIACTPVQRMDWGSITLVTLPGGGQLGVYQAHHARPPSVTADAPWHADDGAAQSGAGKTSSRREPAQARAPKGKAAKAAQKPARKAPGKAPGKAPKKAAKTSARKPAKRAGKRSAPKARAKTGRSTTKRRR